jgi:hypothetical protein
MKNFFFALLLVACPAFACDFPPKGILDKPQNEYRRKYSNLAWRYSVIIPGRCTGYDQKEPPHHGFGLVLEENGPWQRNQSYVAVNGEANTLEYKTPAEAAAQKVKYLREESKRVESSKISQTRLGGLRAVRLVVRYQCPNSKENYVLDSTIALGPGPLYEVTLYAHASRYSHDRLIVQQLIKTWKYLEPIS